MIIAPSLALTTPIVWSSLVYSCVALPITYRPCIDGELWSFLLILVTELVLSPFGSSYINNFQANIG